MDKVKTRGFRIMVLFIALPALLTSCAVRVTFRGSSVPQDVHTASVQYFVNRAPLVNPLISQSFTERLKRRITTESRLNISSNVGDVDFSGEITGYNIRPMAIQADAISAETRLTVTVRVRFRNFKDPRANWENTFSAYRDFPSDLNLAAVEEEIVGNIIDQLTENIFNRAFSDW